jgi:hypothetical protein
MVGLVAKFCSGLEPSGLSNPAFSHSVRSKAQMVMSFSSSYLQVTRDCDDVTLLISFLIFEPFSLPLSLSPFILQLLCFPG